jgi:predicted transglutaminase-like cysteine proteinase
MVMIRKLILGILILVLLSTGCIQQPVQTPAPHSTAPPPATKTVTTPVAPNPIPIPTSEPAVASIPATTPTAVRPSLETLQISTELLSRKYEWDYGGSQWTWDMEVPEALYDYYKALPRSPTRNYSIYVTHPLDDQLIDKLVNSIKNNAQKEGYTELQTVSFATAFVQSLAYTSDSLSTGYDEYPRYPFETIVDNGGDCEDTSILLASLIKSMGYGVVLIIFPKTVDSPGHCAVGVAGGEGINGSFFEYLGRKYFYIETTDTGWEIGHIPDEYRNNQARIYPMVPVPVLTHDWTVEGNGNTVELHVTVRNLGSATAQNVYVYAGFDAGNDQVWNRQASPLFQLDVNGSITANFNLIPPYRKHTRLAIQVSSCQMLWKFLPAIFFVSSSHLPVQPSFLAGEYRL